MSLFYKIVIGDSRDMREVDPSSIDLVVTSPPYYNLDVFSKVGEPGWKQDLSRIQVKDEFFKELTKVWKNCWVVLKPGKWLVCEWEDYPVGSRIYGYPREICLCGDMVDSIERAGLYLISRWFWRKFEAGVALSKFQYQLYKNLRQSDPRAVANLAYCFVFKKMALMPVTRELDFSRKEWGLWSDAVWNIEAGTSGAGEVISGGAVFPVRLIERLIRIYTNKGDVVLDPFLGCYDEQTEVLTRSGWKFFKDLTYDDEIATLSSGWLVYSKPLKILKEPYEGEMLHLKTKTVDLLITPDHHVYAALRDSRIPKAEWKYSIHSAKDLVGKFFILKRDANWIMKEKEYFELPAVLKTEAGCYHRFEYEVPKKLLPMNAWLKFFGFWLAEGYTSDGYTVGFRTSEEEYVKQLCWSLKFKTSNVSEESKVVVHNKQLWSYLKQFGKAPDKFIPRELLELPPWQLKLLLESYMIGDGNLSKYTCYTSSIKLRDDLQEIALKCGYAATYYIHRKAGERVYSKSFRRFININYDQWIVQIIRGQLRPKVEYNKGWNSEYYKGYIYCAEVPGHVMYVRREGKPLWCGNTGTTMLAARRLGRSCIGYEVLPKMLRTIKVKVGYGSQLLTGEQVEWSVIVR